MNIKLNGFGGDSQKLILGLGEKILVGDFIITNWSLGYPVNFIDLLSGDREIVQPKHYELDLSAVSTGEVITEDFGTQKIRIRDKRVEDCTIKELLFAIRQKAK